MTSEFDTTSCDPSGALPTQVSAGCRWNADTSGPRALMLAVLEDAVQCIEVGRRSRRYRARRLAAEAEAWVRCDRREWPFSFANICEVLGFEVDALRKRLLAMPHDASRARRLGLRAPIRIRTMTLAPELRRVGTGGMR